MCSSTLLKTKKRRFKNIQGHDGIKHERFFFFIILDEARDHCTHSAMLSDTITHSRVLQCRWQYDGAIRKTHTVYGTLCAAQTNATHSPRQHTHTHISAFCTKFLIEQVERRFGGLFASDITPNLCAKESIHEADNGQFALDAVSMFRVLFLRNQHARGGNGCRRQKEERQRKRHESIQK